MIDPITATIALSAGANVANKLTSVATNALQKASGTATAQAAGLNASFQDAYDSTAIAAFQKLFAQHPELQSQLGQGPYNLVQNANGSLQLTSQATGNTMTLDATTPVGQQAISLANSFQLNNMQNGLELATV